MASSNVSLSVFGQTFLEEERLNFNLRRNYLYLFDNMKNEVLKIDSSIGISLLDRKS